MEADLANVVAFLTLAFKDQRGREFWLRAVQHLAQHATPAGYPRFGALLESGDRIVGVILQIFSQADQGGVRCNMSSWWVAPEYRTFGGLLISRALRHKATYTNITPAPQTFPILEAQGYRPYCSGRLVSPAWLARGPERARVRAFTNGLVAGRGLSEAAVTILRDHAGFGCTSVVCESGGRLHPFVFAPRRRAGVGLAVLTYSEADGDFARFAGPLGRYLGRRGYPLTVLDADGPVAGVPGWYSAGRPKYYRGPERPRIGDHAYTERAMFGS